MSTTEFRNSTLSYFELISRNKFSTISANYTVFDIAISRINPAEQRQISLQNTQNVMLSVASRTKPRFCKLIIRVKKKKKWDYLIIYYFKMKKLLDFYH